MLHAAREGKQREGHAQGRPKGRPEERKHSRGLRQEVDAKLQKLKSERNTGSADSKWMGDASLMTDTTMAPPKHPSPNPWEGLLNTPTTCGKRDFTDADRDSGRNHPGLSRAQFNHRSPYKQTAFCGWNQRTRARWLTEGGHRCGSSRTGKAKDTDSAESWKWSLALLTIQL